MVIPVFGNAKLVCAALGGLIAAAALAVSAQASHTRTNGTTLNPGSPNATVSWQKGYHWILGNQRFVPLAIRLWSTDPSGCPQPQAVKQALSIGAQMVVMRSGECGSTPSEQIQNMHQLLSGSLWWNDFDVPLTPDWNQPSQAELIAVPADPQLIDAGCTEQGCISSTGQVYNDVRKSIPTYSSLSLSSRSDLGGLQTPTRLVSEFWLTVTGGGGVYFDVKHNQQPEASLLAAAHKTVSRLATISRVLFNGKAIAIKQNTKVPMWVKQAGRWKVAWRKSPWPPIRLLGWRYNGKLYLLALNGGMPPGHVATSWNVHRNGQWHHYTWTPSASVTLRVLNDSSMRSPWGSKGLKLRSSTATIHLPALMTGLYVLTPKK